MRLLVKCALAVIVLDQATKLLVVVGLDLRHVGEIDVLPPWLTFRMAWNEGVNFGLLADSRQVMRWLLVALALAIAAWVMRWAGRQRRDWKVQAAAGLLVGGAIGNVIDRVTWGAVADFLNTSCCGISNPYAFNIADVAIFLGAVGLILWTDRTKTRDGTGRIG